MKHASLEDIYAIRPKDWTCSIRWMVVRPGGQASPAHIKLPKRENPQGALDQRACHARPMPVDGCGSVWPIGYWMGSGRTRLDRPTKVDIRFDQCDRRRRGDSRVYAFDGNAGEDVARTRWKASLTGVYREVLLKTSWEKAEPGAHCFSVARAKREGSHDSDGCRRKGCARKKTDGCTGGSSRRVDKGYESGKVAAAKTFLVGTVWVAA